MLFDLLKRGPKEVNGKIREKLQKEFNLDSQTLAKLRLLQKSGRYSGRSVTFVRIYDPTLVNKDKPVKGFEDLSANKTALMFEGHIEKGGIIHLADRRPPTASSPSR